MAQDSTALVVPGTGKIYVAAADTAYPTDVGTPGVGWTEIGYTSVEGLTITFEMETEELRVWQETTPVRSSVTSVTCEVAFTAHQIDEFVLPLFFGGGAPDGTTGRFEVPKSPTPQTKALLIVMTDGSAVWPAYAAKVAFRGAGEMTASPEGLLTLPLVGAVQSSELAAALMEFGGPTFTV